tara:strand:+ start:81 stop:779 length:699 start_codon:yes stop_codon:yes gene_type:complete
MKLLLVEDEEDLAQGVVLGLEAVGFQVTHVTTGRAGLDVLLHETFALVILDLMLPDLTGLEICRQLRRDPSYQNLPVLMLTARGETYDRVVGFEAGADDYLVKPFAMRELELRIRALLRRPNLRTETSVQQEDAIEFGSLVVDLPGHRVLVDDQELACTALEFKLLVTLLERRGRVQSREVLLDDVWGTETFVSDRTVDTHIKRLREKLGSAGSYIETVRGVGYRFRSQETP